MARRVMVAAAGVAALACAAQAFGEVSIATIPGERGDRGDVLVADARATGYQSSGWAPVLGSPVTVASFNYPPVSRGVFEYWAAATPPGYEIGSFSFEFYLDYPMGLPVQMRAYFYRADGVIEAADFVRTDLLVGLTPRLEFAQRWYTMDVTNVAALNAELDGSRRFGILLTGVDGRATITLDRVNITWVEVPGPSVLTVVGVAGGVHLVRRSRSGSGVPRQA